MHNKIFNILGLVLALLAAFWAFFFWAYAKTDIQFGFASVLTIQAGALFLKSIYNLTK